MNHISLFSGIGGCDLAAEWMGWNNIASCEINPFGRKVLEYYWPNSYHHDDIHTLTFEKLDYELKKRFGEEWRTDDIILTGGFPCQPYSSAGKRLGKQDKRHLWPEMLRTIREIKPRWVVGENVRGLTNWNGGLVFEEVQTDLEAEGYEVIPFLLPACSVGATHRRERIWFIAHATSNGHKARHTQTGGEEQCSEQRGMQQPSRVDLELILERKSRTKLKDFPAVSPICNGNDGIYSRLDTITFSKWRKESIMAGGNAIVPQLIHQIFKAIEQYEKM